MKHVHTQSNQITDEKRNLLVEGLHMFVLVRYGHALHVPFISDRLKVTAAQQQVHFHPILLLQEVNSLVDFV